MFDKINNEKAIKELKLKIKLIQRSLILMSYGNEEDRPLIYSNLRKSLKVANCTLNSLYIKQIGEIYE